MAGCFLNYVLNLKRRREELHNGSRFMFPEFTIKFLLRLALVIAVSWIFFRYVCSPKLIHGSSMEPTYANRSFNFCWHPSYVFSEPERGDIVMIRLAGPKVMYLKRIVALAGDTVEFKNGVLYVNDKQAVEPYVVSSCDWNLPNRKVEPGNVYVVGDNRSMPIDGHIFGQTAITRIMGKPLW